MECKTYDTIYDNRNNDAKSGKVLVAKEEPNQTKSQPHDICHKMIKFKRLENIFSNTNCNCIMYYSCTSRPSNFVAKKSTFI